VSNPKSSKKSAPSAAVAELDAELLLAAYRNMYTSRAIDDEEIKLKRKNLYYFQISGAGHEAILTAAGMVLKPAHDWFLPYYRDRALCLQLGMTAEEMFMQGVGAVDDPNSGGRQMPAHWGHAALNIVSKSSCTGMHALHAVGVAEAGRYLEMVEAARERGSSFEDDEVVYMSIGDGSISEGEFWEALNSICNLKLPVLVLVEDNGYAISTPRSVQIGGIPIHEQIASFPNISIHDVDGNDFEASYATMQEAVAYCRARKGPALVRATCVRPYSHSMSDDERMYRPEHELVEQQKRDPLVLMRRLLIERGIANAEELETHEAEWRTEVLDASERAQRRPKHTPDHVFLHLYSEDVDPTGPDFEAQADPDGRETYMLEAINQVLREEMAVNPNIVVFGEDVADATNEEVLEHCKGKGGVFKATHGLQASYGKHRVFNSPLAEANIVGRAVGMATRGLKPVVEIQFFDYIWPAYMQLKNEMAMMRWRSFGHFKSPMVVRVASGGYLQGGGVYHSQSGVNLFTHLPGVRVVMPCNSIDAAGLLRTAIRCEDPVMFLEHKHLYRQPHGKGPYPGPDFTIPFGKARLHREGDDLTIVTYGATLRRSDLAAKEIEKEGVSVEILDLRSLSPWDHEAVAASVKKTNRCLVVYEDNKSFGFGAEVAAWVADELFEYLDAPVGRVAAVDTPVAYQPDTEDFILPQTEDVVAAARRLVGF
jgi:2-oxoisovalerate dehydrogenase E1 component